MHFLAQDTGISMNHHGKSKMLKVYRSDKACGADDPTKDTLGRYLINKNIDLEEDC